jgi:RNA polymerase sigma factor (sigma-70 family)
MKADMDLVREYAGGRSESAFATLVTRHIGLVHSAALRQVADPHLAEEVTQSVFIILARKAGSLSAKTILAGWLYRTTCFASAHALREQRRRQRREQEAYMQSQTEEPSAEAAWTQLAPILDEAMGQLREKDRNAVVLRFFQNKSLSEVGAALGVAERAAQKRVLRSLEKLRAFFAKRGLVLTTAAIAAAVSAHSVQAAPPALAQTVSGLALAEGAGVSASGMVLAKGVLEVMAWSKAKTAAVVGALGLLAVGTTMVVVEESEPDIQGIWEATALLPGAGVQPGESPKTRLLLHITKTNGLYRATGDSIDQGLRGVPVDKFVYAGRHLHAEIAAANDIFDGQVNRAGTAISGEWKEGEASGFLVFKRTTNPPPFPEPLSDQDFVPRAGSDLQGYWLGVIGQGKGALHVAIKIAEPSAGKFRADFYSLDQGALRQPALVNYDGAAVELRPMAGYGMFEGELRGNNEEMVGNWIQGGQEMPTRFTRAKFTPPPNQPKLVTGAP